MTKIYAHRGFSGVYPENTMLAFQKAYEIGADGIEYDVHVTKDGECVVMHDENTIRTTGVDNLIKDMTCEEFLALDAGFVCNGKFGVVHPPKFEEVVKFCSEKSFKMNIEIKTGVYEYPNIERKILNILDKYNMRDLTIISSFNHFTCLRFKELAPDVKIGLLEESWLIKPGSYTRDRGAECFHPFFNMLTFENLQDLRNNHIEINSWTINDEKDMLNSLKMNLEIGITNYPDKYLEIRSEYEKH